MKKGFTLIEIVIVFAILCILLGASVQSARGLNSFRNKIEVKKFISELQSARNMAIASRKVTKVVLNNTEYSVITQDQIQTHKLPKGMYIQSMKNEDNDIIFTIKGRPSNKTSRTINIKCVNKTYEITVSPVTGKVNLK